MVDRLKYLPNTIIPQDTQGIVKYLQEELDKISYTFENLDFATLEDIDPENPDSPAEPPITEHNDLNGRTEFDAHPIGAITGLAEEQLAQDVLIHRNTKVFFGPDEPSEEESSEGDLWFVSGYE